jgi:hypothetical protein
MKISVASDKVFIQWITFLRYTFFFLTFDSKKEKLYCAFIYFENEFDKVAIEQYQWKNVSNYTKYVQKH